jgi:hypothetical protein
MRPVWVFLGRMRGNGLSYEDLEPHCALAAAQIRAEANALVRTGSGRDMPEEAVRALERALELKGVRYERR